MERKDGKPSFIFAHPFGVRAQPSLVLKVDGLVKNARKSLSEVILSGKGREVVLKGKKTKLGTFTPHFGYVTAERAHITDGGEHDELRISVAGRKPFAKIDLETGRAEINGDLRFNGARPKLDEVLREI